MKRNILGALVSAAYLAITGCGDKNHGVKGPEHMALSFVTREGIRYDLGLNRYSDRVMVLDPARKESRLGFYENQDRLPGDSLVLTNPANNFTHVLKFERLDPVHKAVFLSDYATGPKAASYEASSKRGAVIVGGVAYGFTVLDEVTGRLAIDQTGDGDRQIEQAPIAAMRHDGTVEFKLEEDLLLR